MTLVVAPILAEFYYLTCLQGVFLERKAAKSGHTSGLRSKTMDRKIIWTFHTDRALIGDGFRTLKQVLGR